MPAHRRLTILSLACIALVASGCGNADKGKLTSKQGDKLTKYVETAQAAYDKKDCAGAREAATAGANKVAALHGDVDTDLRANLIDGFKHLESELASNCDKPVKTPTATATATETATATPTETASPEPTATETASPTATATAEPTATATPDNGGGFDGNPTATP